MNKNKSRVDDWLKVNRLQLPLPNAQSNSATNSIPEKSENVNRKSKNFERSEAEDARWNANLFLIRFTANRE